MVRRLRRRLGGRRHRRRRARVHARPGGHAASSASPAATSSCAENLRDDVRRRAARARLRLHRQDARAARRRRRARALHRRRHLPGGAGGRHAGRLLRPAGRPRAAEHARDGRPRPAAPGQRHRRAARARAGELRRREPPRGEPRRASPARRRRAPRRSTSCCDAPRRVRPIPLWRLRLVALATQVALLLGDRLLDDVDRRGHRARGDGARRAPAHARARPASATSA